MTSTRDGHASRRIADGLRQAILTGDLGPGARIRQEDLAARFSASRVPVRDALRILEAERLVTLVANSGAWVSHFNLAECEEMYQVRERVEPLLLRARTPVAAETIDRMAELATLMESDEDVDALLAHDREFHWLPYAAARTVVLADIVEQVWNTTHRYRRAFAVNMDAQARTVMNDEHHMLVRALRAGDTEHAEQVLKGHIRRTRVQLKKCPEIFEQL